MDDKDMELFNSAMHLGLVNRREDRILLAIAMKIMKWIVYAFMLMGNVNV